MGAALKRCTINAATFAVDSGPERASFGAVRWRGGPGRVYGTWEIWGEDTTISNQPGYHAESLPNSSEMFRYCLGCSDTVIRVRKSPLLLRYNAGYRRIPELKITQQIGHYRPIYIIQSIT